MLFHIASRSFIAFFLNLLFCSLTLAEQTIIQTEQTQPSFRIHGSNTVGEKFAPDLIRGFLRQKGFLLTSVNANLAENSTPELERIITGNKISKNDSINIELFAHGSSTGFKDLLSQKTDIAMSSRKIKDKEKAALQALYPSINDQGTEFVIAFDALAIITHPENPVKKLSTRQLAQIFSGEIGNWLELGGSDQAISVNARDDNSGTYDTFKSLVLKPNKVSLTDTAGRFESSAELANTVASNLGAIGFVGVSHTGESKVIAINSSQQAPAVVPEEHTIGTEDYPLSRKLYLYLPKEISNPLASEFVSFSQSTEGQKLAKRSNLVSYYPIKSKPKLKNLKLTGQFNNLRTFGERLSISFRFEGDTIDAKNKRDIERLRSFHSQNPKQRLVFAAFDPQLPAEQSDIARWMELLRQQIAETSISAWEIQVGPKAFAGDIKQIKSAMDRRIEVWVL